MKFAEKWRIAGVIASEMRFKAFLEANPGNVARMKEDPQKVMKQIKSSGQISAFFTVMIILLLSIMSVATTFASDAVGTPYERMAMGFSLFLILSFVVVFFMNLTSTTGFFTSGAMDLPLTLPMTVKDLEGLAILSFARVLIAPAALIISVFPTITLVIFGPLPALVALVGCTTTVALAMHALIYFARWFYVKTHTADKSRLSGVVRVAASLGLVIGMLSIYSISSYIPTLIEIFGSFSASLGTEGYLVISLLYPFSFGFLAGAAAFGPPAVSLSVWTAVAGCAVYGAAGWVAFRRSGVNLRSVVTGGLPSLDADEDAGEVTLNVRRPMIALARKDLKLATRNIGSAFLFAIPVFLVVVLAPVFQIWEGGARSLTAIMALSYANLFSGLALIGILMFDTQGASIHAGLPISTYLSLRTKSAIAFATYIFSMILIALLLTLSNPVSELIPLTAIIQIPAGYAVGLAVGGMLYKYRGGGRAVSVNLTGDQAVSILSGAVSLGVGSVPLVFYGLVLLATGMHLYALIAQALGVIILMAAVLRFVPRWLVD
ncbi:MAG: hypothetical protein ACP6KW_05245 [Candidatus Thorarchaeota archaeon]